MAESSLSEVKLLLAPGQNTTAAKRLDLAFEGDKRVWFFDTRDGELLRDHGLILRIRRGTDDDITVKLRPREPIEAFEQSVIPRLECESDIVGLAVHRSYSLEEEFKSGDIPDDGSEFKKKLTKDQRTLIDTAGVNVPWKRLTIHGPIASLEWRKKLGGGRRLSMEAWTYKELEILELSMKLPSDEAGEGSRTLERLAGENDLPLDPDQGSKTARIFALAERASG